MREHTAEKTFEYDDFKNGEEVEKLCSFSFEEDEICVEATGTIVPYSPAVLYPVERSHPAEGGYCEDISVEYKKENGDLIDLTEYLKEKVLSNLEHELYEEYGLYEQDEKEYAMEAKWEADKDDRLMEDN